MGRQFTEKPPELLEQIMEDCLKIVGAELNENQIKLLLRLIISGIAKYYFKNPDDLINLGFLKFTKSPEKNELFKVLIIRDEEAGVTNAEALWRYYKGDIKQEKQIKETMNNFLENLINYSKAQEEEITKSISQIEKRRRD